MSIRSVLSHRSTLNGARSNTVTEPTARVEKCIITTQTFFSREPRSVGNNIRRAKLLSNNVRFLRFYVVKS